MIVIPEDCDLRRVPHGPQCIGAWFGKPCAFHPIRLAKWMRGEIASENHEVWIEGLCEAYSTLHSSFTHVWPKVDVADLRNAKVVKLFRQPGHRDVDSLGDDISGFDEK